MFKKDQVSASAQNNRKPRKKNWYQDRYQSLVVQRNILILVSFLALSLTVVATALVMVTLNSKEIEPFVIEVQEKSGVATVVDQLTVKQYVAKESILRYFVAQYLKSREEYDIGTFEHNFFRIVRLMSDGSVFSHFKRSISKLNKESPLNLGPNRERKVSVKSIIFFDPVPGTAGRTAQVRFQVTDSVKGSSQVLGVKHKVLLMDFDFINLNLSHEDRYINPLGFVVKNYKTDEDSS